MTEDLYLNDADTKQGALYVLAQALRTEIGGSTWPTNPPATPRPVRNEALRSAVTGIEAEFAALKVGFLVFDGPESIYYGWRDDENEAIGSTAKLMILYGAFQLREDVRAVLRANSALRDPKEVKRKLRQAWAASPVPSLKALGALGDNDPPFLEDIFDFTLGHGSVAADTIELAGMAPCGLSSLYEDVDLTPGKRQLMKDLQRWEPDNLDRTTGKWKFVMDLPFAQRLWMTTRWSDNVAATTCAMDIGLRYIDALMLESRLLSSPDGDGLRLRAPYQGFPDGVEIPASWSAKLKQRTVRYKFRTIAPGLWHQGTARSLAALMIALQRRVLIDVTASDQMMAFVRHSHYVTSGTDAAFAGGGFGTRSFIDLALLGATPDVFPFDTGRPYADFLTKLGIEPRTVEEVQKDGTTKEVTKDLRSDWSHVTGGTKLGGSVDLGIIVIGYAAPPEPQRPDSAFARCVIKLATVAASPPAGF